MADPVPRKIPLGEPAESAEPPEPAVRSDAERGVRVAPEIVVPRPESNQEAALRMATRTAEAAEETARKVATRTAEVAEEAARKVAEGGAAAEETARRVATRTAEVAEKVAERSAEAGRVVASRSYAIAEAVASRSASAAQSAMQSMRGGIDAARQGLADERAEWDRIALAAEFPAIASEDAMADLAARLDRETYFWRAFALRSMKPGAGHVIATIAGAMALIGGIVIVLLAALRALFGASGPATSLWVALGALAGAVLVALLAATWLRRSTTKVANEALVRADEAERKLQRAAAILALAKTDKAAYKEALVRFERL